MTVSDLPELTERLMRHCFLVGALSGTSTFTRSNRFITLITRIHALLNFVFLLSAVMIIAKDISQTEKIGLSATVITMTLILIWFLAAVIAQYYGMKAGYQKIDFFEEFASMNNLEGVNQVMLVNCARAAAILPMLLALIAGVTGVISYLDLVQIAYSMSFIDYKEYPWIIPVNTFAMVVAQHIMAHFAGVYFMVCLFLAHLMNVQSDQLAKNKHLKMDSLLETQFCFDRVARAAEKADEHFKTYNLLVLGAYTGVLTLLGYVVIMQSSSSVVLTPLTLMINAFWMVSILLQVLSIIIPAIMVHEAGQSLESVISAKHTALNNTDTSIKLQLLCFLEQVRTRDIGMSVGRAFVIDRSTVIGMLSTILTYLIIMLQSAANVPENKLVFNSTAALNMTK